MNYLNQNLIQDLVARHTGMRLSPQEITSEELRLRKIWNQSLDNGTPDYSGYDEKTYPWLCWDCWKGWSRLGINCAIKYFDTANGKDWRLGYTGQILDLGAGIGVTTLQIAREFPNATVTYHNLPGLQADIAKDIFKVYQQKNISTRYRESAEIIFALEFLEHIKDPIQYLKKHVKEKARYIIDSSSFTIDNHAHERVFEGHFQRHQIRRHVNNWYRELYFSPQKLVRFWNNKPAIWTRTHP